MWAKEGPDILQSYAHGSVMTGITESCHFLSFWSSLSLNPVRMNFRCIPSGVCFQLQRATQTLERSVNKHPSQNHSSTRTARWEDSVPDLVQRASARAARVVETICHTAGHTKSERSTMGGSSRSFSKFRWVDLCVDAACWKANASCRPGMSNKRKQSNARRSNCYLMLKRTWSCKQLALCLWD